MRVLPDNSLGGLAPIDPSRLTTCNPALQNAQECLLCPIPLRVFCLLAITRGEQISDAHIYPDLGPGWGLRFGLCIAVEGGVPDAGLPADAEGPDLALDWPVPADCDSPNACDFQAPSI